MIESIASALIVALVVGSIGSAFTKPRLYENKIQPLMSKLGLIIMIFALGASVGALFKAESFMWLGLTAVGLFVQLGSLMLAMIISDIETDEDGSAKLK